MSDPHTERHGYVRSAFCVTACIGKNTLPIQGSFLPRPLIQCLQLNHVCQQVVDHLPSRKIGHWFLVLFALSSRVWFLGLSAFVL